MINTGRWNKVPVVVYETLYSQLQQKFITVHNSSTYFKFLALSPLALTLSVLRDIRHLLKVHPS